MQPALIKLNFEMSRCKAGGRFELGLLGSQIWMKTCYHFTGKGHRFNWNLSGSLCCIHDMLPPTEGEVHCKAQGREGVWV
jgi:hypothetical protein